MAIAKIFSDGGSRGNPGPAATGWLVFIDGKLADLGGKHSGSATNNFAEYSALLDAVTTLAKYCVKQNIEIDEIICHLDSELVVKQLRGEYKIKNEDLQKLAKKVHEMLKKFRAHQMIHIPREQNRLADRIVNMNMDAASDI